MNDYNHERYHESLDSLTPADVYYGRGQTILKRRERFKLKTLPRRKQNHHANRANQLN
ncbi:MAG TPA: transposase [Pseudomonadales bacterium]|nr:transposase [Pseudomonadales bacterium]